MPRHRRSKHTLEVYYATTLIYNIAHEQFVRYRNNLRHRGYALYEIMDTRGEKIIDRWIYAPDRWHDCPTHRLTKYTPIQHTVEYIIKFCNNKPADWSTILWTNYMNNLYERYSRFD